MPAKRAIAGQRSRKIRPLSEHPIKELRTLSAARQDAIAGAILAEVRRDGDAKTGRFQELVEAKYTRGLTAAESTEMERLEAGFRDADEAFYRPIIEAVKAKRSSPAKRVRNPLR